MAATLRTAQIIHQCWQQGRVIDALPPDCQPADIAEAYRAQAALADLQAEPVLGWKIAATAEAGRQHINVDHPLAGRLFASKVSADGATVALQANRMGMAEAEFVLMLGRDLPARSAPYTDAEVATAIAAVHPGLELPDSRFADFTKAGAAGLLADNACAGLFVLGPAASGSFDPAQLSEQPTTLWVNDEIVTQGTGSDALGGPLPALTWLANTLSEHGVSLQRGQFVTTGVTGAPSPVRAGDEVRADLGRFGSVRARLTP